VQLLSTVDGVSTTNVTASREQHDDDAPAASTTCCLGACTSALLHALSLARLALEIATVHAAASRVLCAAAARWLRVGVSLFGDAFGGAVAADTAVGAASVIADVCGVLRQVRACAPTTSTTPPAASDREFASTPTPALTPAVSDYVSRISDDETQWFANTPLFAHTDDTVPIDYEPVQETALRVAAAWLEVRLLSRLCLLA
jgi:hypothetical protein